MTNAQKTNYAKASRIWASGTIDKPSEFDECFDDTFKASGIYNEIITLEDSEIIRKLQAYADGIYEEIEELNALEGAE